MVDDTISSLFLSAEGGDRSAADALFAALYDELHRLARRQLARKAPDLALGATTLLHEAYLDMKAREGTVFPDQASFMGYAARVMRAVIIDHVRNRKARKRGGEFEITSLPVDVPDPAAEAKELAKIGEAVDGLARVDPLLAQIVDLKFFCGFSFAEIAAMRGLSERTVQRHWDKARLYLHDAIQDAT
ncbi:MAG TPA: ECF-type sigma factor [Vicinamibacteria bacterium]|nr:ECF-type sigma factor [Vicinamibacteria bacterium]